MQKLYYENILPIFHAEIKLCLVPDIQRDGSNMQHYTDHSLWFLSKVSCLPTCLLPIIVGFFVQLYFTR